MCNLLMALFTAENTHACAHRPTGCLYSYKYINTQHTGTLSTLDLNYVCSSHLVAPFTILGPYNLGGTLFTLVLNYECGSHLVAPFAILGPNNLVAENILLAQELVRNYHKEKGIPRCAVKVDVMKAYDSIDWNFVLQCLHTIGAPGMYLDWVKECTLSNQELQLTYLCFADDLLIFCSANPIRYC